ncbi:unnamed protein product [Trichobilharzia regenti]|nr:unnamed protein product [Trichobilharzia regenti]
MLKLNVTLSRKLKVKEEIQADYLDMIAHLESVIAQLQEEKASTISNVKDSSILSYCQIDDYETEDAEVTSLTEALNTSDNDDEVARSAQADEVKRLKDEISKLEDRRRRAEKLIVRQRETISRLKLDLHRSVTENRRKFNEYIAKMAKKYNNDDEINKLLAERESLLQENAKLMHEVQILEEIEVCYCICI